MRFLSWGIVAACGFLLAVPAAKAADWRIPDRGTPSPHYNWTGFYAGVFGAAAHAEWTVDYYRNGYHGHAEGSANGFAFGGYGGYNYQFANRLVIGGELDLGMSTGSLEDQIFGNDVLMGSFGAFGSARMRAGYAFDRLLLFGTIGVGVASISNGYRYTYQKGCNTLQEAIWNDEIRAGLTTGAGVEYAFTGHLVGRGEYVYTDYGSVTLSNRDRNRAEFRNEMHLVRVGASYRF